MKGGFFMKLLKKIIPFVVVLATVFSVFGVQNTFADSQIKKGSTRVVMFGTEIDPCEDEVVYQVTGIYRQTISLVQYFLNWI